MSEKMVIRIGDEAQKAVEALAEDLEIGPGEAADKLITMGWNRRRALHKWSKAQAKDKPAKPKKAKVSKKKAKAAAKPKAAKKKASKPKAPKAPKAPTNSIAAAPEVSD